jgi:uncharacterized protein
VPNFGENEPMKDKELKKISEQLAPLFRKNMVMKVILFGSAARGSESRKSDLDFMIIKKTEKRFFERYDEFEEMYHVIKDRALDLLIYTPDELENISHRPFIRRILQEGVTVYEY